jgi:hypothetical protein
MLANTWSLRNGSSAFTSTILDLDSTSAQLFIGPNSITGVQCAKVELVRVQCAQWWTAQTERRKHINAHDPLFIREYRTPGAEWLITVLWGEIPYQVSYSPSRRDQQEWYQRLA